MDTTNYLTNKSELALIPPTILLAQCKSTKRLQRKPSTRLLKSPKSKYKSQFDDGSLVISKKESSNSNIASHQQLQNLPPKIKNLDSIRNICYISPRNSQNQTKRFSRVSQNMFGCEQVNLSIQQIETDELIQLNFNIQPPSKQATTLRKTTNKTNNEIRNIKINENQHMTQSHQVNPKQQEITALKKQNNRLTNENGHLSARLKNLKQQNEYLYGQIQSLNQMLAREKELSQSINQINLQLNEKNYEIKRQLEQYKSHYKINEQSQKNYFILQQIFLKVKNQSQQISKKNRSLLIQNQKLLLKVSNLSKLLEEHPMESKTQRVKVRGRRLSQIVNKENNFEKSSVICPINLEIKSPRANRSKVDQSFFQLTPE